MLEKRVGDTNFGIVILNPNQIVLNINVDNIVKQFFIVLPTVF
jgi:hypothetical protein